VGERGFLYQSVAKALPGFGNLTQYLVLMSAKYCGGTSLCHLTAYFATDSYPGLSSP